MWLAAVLARPHGRAPRMARVLWRDEPPLDAAVRGLYALQETRRCHRERSDAIWSRLPRHLAAPRSDDHASARVGARIMKIGFIGVGNIGAPIAVQLLQAGHVPSFTLSGPRPRARCWRRRVRPRQWPPIARWWRPACPDRSRWSRCASGRPASLSA